MSNPDRLLESIAGLVAELCDGADERVELDDGSSVKGRLPALLDLLDAETRGAAGGGAAGGSSEGRLPLFTPAYDALLAITATAYRLAGIVGAPARSTTRDTLRGVVGSSGGHERIVLLDVERELREQVDHARRVLSIDLPPIPLRGVLCPYCLRPSVLAARREHRAWCSTRGCVDDDERPYVWAGETALRLLGATQREAYERLEQQRDTPHVPVDPSPAST